MNFMKKLIQKYIVGEPNSSLSNKGKYSNEDISKIINRVDDIMSEFKKLEKIAKLNNFSL